MGAKDELSHIATDAQEVLVTARTVFPLDPFPDTIAIDRVKVTVTRRTFFFAAEIVSMQIEDILNVEETLGPYFGTLKIYTRFYNNEPMTINRLARKDTAKIKHILQGYVIARTKKIDCSNISSGDLVPLLLNLGKETDYDDYNTSH